MNQALRYFGWPLLAGLLLALLLIQRYPHWVGLDQPGAHGQALLGARSQAATYSYANAVDKASPAVATWMVCFGSMVGLSVIKNN